MTHGGKRLMRTTSESRSGRAREMDAVKKITRTAVKVNLISR